MKNILLFLTFLFMYSLTYAQSLERLDIKVSSFGDELKLALSGGLNTPQFNEVDLDNNGVLDLYIFDRTGDVSLTFLNNGTPDMPDYEYAPAHQSYFPELNDWVLLRDYDGDGAVDIFSYSDTVVAGFVVYKGKYINNHLAFNRINFIGLDYNLLPLEISSGLTNLYVEFIDYPAVDDIDGDGDLDIISFLVGGGYAGYYENQSVERGYGLDSLIFVQADHCWGKFFETGMFGIFLSDDPSECSTGFVGDHADQRHSGTTLLTIDMDNDNDKDLVIGDLSLNNLTMLTNGGDQSEAWMIQQDVSFPSNSLPVDISSFVAPYSMDLDNDGKRDLVASSNNSNNGENYEVVWFYKNVNTNEEPVFQFLQKDFLVEDMIDLGTGAHPAFVDYNADGLLDLVVGNDHFFLPFGDKAPRLYLFENIGTSTAPEFNLVDDDYLNFSAYDGTAKFGLAPTFGDLDGDSDLDLIVGDQQGSMFYAENFAGEGNPLVFGTLMTNWMDIDIGNHLIPQIVDLDRDGLPDLVLGERSGQLLYFHNEGSLNEPLFVPNIDFETPFGENIIGLGGVDTRFMDGSQLPPGYAAPLILDFGDEFALFAGSDAGHLLHYTNIDDHINGLFDLETKKYGRVREGFRTHPAIADIDNDGVLEMVVGNRRGGISMFKTTYTIDGSVPVNYVYRHPEVKLSPNPAEDHVNVEIENRNGAYAHLTIYNAIGQVVFNEKFNASNIRIQTENFVNGIYFCEVRLGSAKVIKRVVITQ